MPSNGKSQVFSGMLLIVNAPCLLQDELLTPDNGSKAADAPLIDSLFLNKPLLGALDKNLAIGLA